MSGKEKEKSSEEVPNPSDAKKPQEAAPMDVIRDDDDGPSEGKKGADLSALVDDVLPRMERLAESGRVAEAVEELLATEKQTRQAGDVTSTSRLAVCIVNLCFKAQQWKMLNENLVLLSKRRGQLKTSIQKMVQAAMGFLDSLQKPEQLALLATLIEVTEGKIFVEIERARLTQRLAKIREDEGDKVQASKILQEVQVETFGAMDKFEKTAFILEQMRLCLDTDDFVRAQIFSRKISPKALAPADMADLAVRYHKLMIRYYTNEDSFLEIGRSYRSIAEVLKEPEAREPNLMMVVVFGILAPWDNESNSLLQLADLDKGMRALPAYKSIIRAFLTMELMSWSSVRASYEAVLNQHAIFQAPIKRAGGLTTNLWDVLRIRVVEHNIRVVSTYYSRITLKRLAALLDLDKDATEKHVTELVNAKTIRSRIDRPSGIVTFAQQKSHIESMNEWSGRVANVLELVESTCHLISKENMVHKIASRV